MIRALTGLMWVVLAGFLAGAMPAWAQDADALLAQARAELGPDCAAQPQPDRLSDILCAGEIRIGVRDGYPNFAVNRAGIRAGYEIDLARRIAGIIGVEARLVDVTPVTRISALSNGTVDLVIATMGHNSVRDANARFIRPHYYSSETILIGPRRLRIDGWGDVADRTVCTTVGNFANAMLVERVARLMLFDTPARLIENLESGTCLLIVQDDSVMVNALADPDFGGRFERKLGISEIPWGMAVALDGTDRLGAVLDALSIQLHSGGALLEMAVPHGIELRFLERMQNLWSQPGCQDTPSVCVLAPLNTDLDPGPLKAVIAAINAWMQDTFAFLYSQFAWDLFINGVAISLVAVVGVLIATLLISLLFAAGLLVKNRLLNGALGLLLMIFQGSPPILILVMLATFANAIFFYSLTVALFVAILAIGLVNGAFAGQGIADAWRSLDDRISDRSRLRRAIVRAGPQIEAFLTNATRGIAAASYVGVADLTNAMNDIASFSRNQSITYWILLIFYVLVVMAVVKLSRALRLKLEYALAGE
ncbi:transporter substrate-binding domain-containing protein [Aestuariivita sp.]|uniref:transporter substrate-binding domain-containing protein n=1 Tax=Aestuariivita sp. TaxID=1872407 RepID=UPI0021739C31|nr:transporter substrate-binding domain-containing protein [Aestuariivita sp.]MCE8009017.1 transporter substrate-binding domain-containing protein [Aestuariivita sp.]